MVKVRASLTGLILAVAVALPAAAGDTCTCRANGTDYDEGTVVCLRIPQQGMQLMRCDRVLNNTSWKKVQDGCPQASLALPGNAPLCTASDTVQG